MQRKTGIGDWFRRQMAGRYGPDQLSRVLSIAALVVLALSLLLRGVAGGALSGVLDLLALAGIGWCYFRILSRNFTARRAENEKFLRLWDRVTGDLRLRRECLHQRKDYCFFRCPSCRQMVRVPRGKGRIRITCRRCGFAFEKKT